MRCLFMGPISPDAVCVCMYVCVCVCMYVCVCVCMCVCVSLVPEGRCVPHTP